MSRENEDYTSRPDNAVYRDEIGTLVYERDEARKENMFWRIGAGLLVIGGLLTWWWL